MKFVKDKSTNKSAVLFLSHSLVNILLINPFHNCLFSHLEASNYTNTLWNFLPGLKILHAYGLSVFSCSTKTAFKGYLKVVILHPISNHISGHIAVQPALNIKLLMISAWMAMDQRHISFDTCDFSKASPSTVRSTLYFISNCGDGVFRSFYQLN